MAARTQFRKLFFLLALVTICAARVSSPRHAFDFSLLEPRQDDTDDIISRVPSCDLDTCGSGGVCAALRRRTAGLEYATDILSYQNASVEGDDKALDKRLFRYNPTSNVYTGDRPPTNAEVNAYLPAVFQGYETSYFGAALGLAANDERTVSQQVQFGTQPFQIAFGGIHGCTVVTLVSQRAVWMAHYWESYSHGKPNKDSPATDPAFQERVIWQLQGRIVRAPSPSTYKPYIAPDGPGIDANLFNQDDDETKLYIMTPVKDGNSAGDTSIKYTNRINAIENAIRRVLGRRPATVRWNYLRLDYNDEADRAMANTNSRGMGLFQFDPNSDGKGTPNWRLFYEDRFYSPGVAT
ncbi:hypothetical protein SCUP234_07376 [Seiridium cupressi]